jgi:hypothetical protein
MLSPSGKRRVVAWVYYQLVDIDLLAVLGDECLRRLLKPGGMLQNALPIYMASNPIEPEKLSRLSGHLMQLSLPSR